MQFEEFLAVEIDGLSRFARALTGDRQEAHDVLADSLEKAQRQWPRISRLQHPRAYLRQMVVRRYLSGQRQWARRTIRPYGQLPVVPVGGGQDRVDDRHELHVLLGTLPKQQRAAVVLRYYLDLPDSEIATTLKCSQGAVRTYISRALAALRIAEAKFSADATCSTDAASSPEVTCSATEQS